MDGGAREAQSVYMNATNAVQASERNQLIIDTIAELAWQPAPTDSPRFFNHGPDGTGADRKVTCG